MSATHHSVPRPVATPTLDPRALQVHRPQPQRDVPYVPTDDAVVAAMLRLADVRENDVVYDLGCGDGRIVISAVKRGAARGVGVDIDLQRIHEATENSKAAGLSRRCTFLRQSFFDADVRDATVVTLYLLPGINKRLMPKLLWDCRPRTRIVSNNFEMGDWPPDATDAIHHRTLFKWVVPAWVQGDWKCTLGSRLRLGTGSPRAPGHLRLTLRRRYQKLSGSAHAGRREIHLIDGRIRGDEVSFSLWHPQDVNPPIHFTAVHRDGCLRGTCGRAGPGEAWHPWAGIRANTALKDAQLH